MTNHGLLPIPEAVAFLESVHRGDIKLMPTIDPQEVYAGNVVYNADNGWRVVVFNDCNEWDYYDAIESDDGHMLGFDDYWDSKDQDKPVLPEPDDEKAWRIYRIPGYLHFRCTSCSKEIVMGMAGPHLCVECGGTKPYPERPCSRCGRDRLTEDTEGTVCKLCLDDDEMQAYLKEHAHDPT